MTNTIKFGWRKAGLHPSSVLYFVIPVNQPVMRPGHLDSELLRTWWCWAAENLTVYDGGRKNLPCMKFGMVMRYCISTLFQS